MIRSVEVVDERNGQTVAYLLAHGRIQRQVERNARRHWLALGYLDDYSFRVMPGAAQARVVEYIIRKDGIRRDER